MIGERASSGDDARGPWRLATGGVREPAVGWTLANVEQSRDRELVFTNVSPFPAKVALHFYASCSFASDVVTTIEIPPRRRLVYRLPVDRSVPWVDGTLRAPSQPTDRGTAEIVVEAWRYVDIGGVARARAAGVAAAPVR